jgi:hypothetical protein
LRSHPVGRWLNRLRPHHSPGDADPLFAAVSAALEKIPVDFGGGCPPKKAYAMAWLIRAAHVRVSLDIGVYRGRSLMPQAVAHRDWTGGVAYGVDPFSKDEAIQRDNPALRERLDEFVQTTDFEQIYQNVLDVRDVLGVRANCVLVRKTSARAAAEFAARRMRFGLIHIDGNHDEARVSEDVELYLPLVGEGGFVVMDDVSWSSVKPAVDLVASRAKLLFYESAPSVTELDYAVFRLGGSERRSRSLSESLRILRGS